jgi:hypothetical protein
VCIDASVREEVEILVEEAMLRLLANVLVPSALRAGPCAFARAERTPERRNPAW